MATDAVSPAALGAAADVPATTTHVLTGVMPDLTPAQIVGLIGAVLAVAVSFGVNISKEQQEAILALATLVAGILFAADAHLRSNRARATAVRHAADTHAATVARVLEHHREIVTEALAKGQAPPPLVYPPPPAPSAR
jgi:hypothetical protein